MEENTYVHAAGAPSAQTLRVVGRRTVERDQFSDEAVAAGGRSWLALVVASAVVKPAVKGALVVAVEQVGVALPPTNVGVGIAIHAVPLTVVVVVGALHVLVAEVVANKPVLGGIIGAVVTARSDAAAAVAVGVKRRRDHLRNEGDGVALLLDLRAKDDPVGVVWDEVVGFRQAR